MTTGQESIDIEDLCVDKVTVESWHHSGPVAVSLEGVWLEKLLDKIPREALAEYVNRPEKVK